MSQSEPGTLFVVATPIGNLEDITLRALRILGEADVIAAEDTRRARKLLTHYKIDTPTVPFHEGNTERALPGLIERLSRGEDIALVSDAGTPGVADPARHLVRAALEADCTVVPIPGPSALPAILSISGFDTREVRMLGFLPKRKSERRDLLRRIAAETAVTVLFESPRRLLDTLDMLDAIAPTRPIVLLREGTKKFEEILRAAPGIIRALLESRGEIKGEITLAIEGAPAAADDTEAATDAQIIEALAKLRDAGIDKRDAIRCVALLLDVPRSRVYHIATVFPA